MSSHRLVRILCPIVLSQALLVASLQAYLCLGRSIGAQIVSDPHLGCKALLFEQLAREFRGGFVTFSRLSGRAKHSYRVGMTTVSYAGYRFPAEIIQHAVWIYLQFTLSYRDVEELLAGRGIDVSHETFRRWVRAFGPRYARRLRAVRLKPNSDWHLDEMFVSVGGKRMYLWRAVDTEGEALSEPRAL
jgi:hypothetical protein